MTTAAPDSLTRLRNRPRLRVTAGVKPTPASIQPAARRANGLLPRRKAGPTPASAEASKEEDHHEAQG